jgi:hypothetical protein
LVINSQFSPVVGLIKGGKYEGIQRDLQSGRWGVYNYLKKYFG